MSPSAGDRVRRGVSEERGALRSELYGRECELTGSPEATEDDHVPAVLPRRAQDLRDVRYALLPPSTLDNPKLTDVVIPEGCFPKARYFSLQGRRKSEGAMHVDHPALTTLEIEDSVMAHGGFCIMRSRRARTR